MNNYKEIGLIINFKKEYVFVWGKDRNYTNNELNKYKDFSLHFLPFQKGYINNRIDILADSGYFSDSVDNILLELIFGKPKMVYDYFPAEDKVYFFRISCFHPEIQAIVYDSCEGHAYWFNYPLGNDIENLYKIPRRRILID
jgi:hypothetical protein